MDRFAIIVALLLSLSIADFARAGEYLPIAGADSLYQLGVAVLVGEFHGTREEPTMNHIPVESTLAVFLLPLPPMNAEKWA